MRILFDQGVRAPLRHSLSGHAVSTAFEEGWSELENGALLKAAAAKFDVLVTTDRNLRFQKNLAHVELAILVLSTTSWPRIRNRERQIAAAVDALRPGDIREFDFD